MSEKFQNQNHLLRYFFNYIENQIKTWSTFDKIVAEKREKKSVSIASSRVTREAMRSRRRSAIAIMLKLANTDLHNANRFPIESFRKHYQLTHMDRLILKFLLYLENLEDLHGQTDILPTQEHIARIISKNYKELNIKKNYLRYESKMLKLGIVYISMEENPEPGYYTSVNLIRLHPAARKLLLTPGEFPKHFRASGNNQDTVVDFTNNDESPVKEQTPNTSESVNILKILKPTATWDSLILADSLKTQIKTNIRKDVISKLKEWGMGKEALSSQKMLFYGSPGTGKTMAAEAIASYLKKDLGIVNLAQVFNKWMGGSEKGVENIFLQARKANCVLLIDEADSILTQRFSEIGSSQENFMNRIVNILLMEIERYDGVTILTTNMENSLDSALERRIQTRIHFPQPSPEIAEQIFRAIIPKTMPIDPTIDFQKLATKYPLTGGYIKNSVINAAKISIEKNKSMVDSSDFEAALILENNQKNSKGKKIQAIGF